MSRLRRTYDAVHRRLPMPLGHIATSPRPETPEVVSRRRRVVAGVCLAGAGLLGASLSSPPGSRRFYGMALSVAATWTLGGLASGPLHLGWIENRGRELRRPVVTPVATGLGAFGFFYGCAHLARRIPVLEESISRVLTFADAGRGPLVLLTTCANGVGEEVFFRGALYTALPGTHPVAASTAIYALSTTTTRNPALVLAAGVMGSLFAMQRRATGGLQAPLLTHLTWSTLMVRFLPPLFRTARRPAGPSVPAAAGFRSG